VARARRVLTKKPGTNSTYSTSTMLVTKAGIQTSISDDSDT
jgi:hypothetical protein